MDTVKQFGNEVTRVATCSPGIGRNEFFSPFLQLNGIRDFRPPVSKAKMASITKLAMKSHKVERADFTCLSSHFYHHFV